MPGPNQRGVLVSACLVGKSCRYDGCTAKAEARARLDSVLEELRLGGPVEVHAFCPEEAGGLGTPRPPAWIEADGAEAVLAGRDRLVTGAGDDVTGAFRRGAEAALAACREHGIERALLKERSPSCGVTQTSVAGQSAAGPGITAALLRTQGILVEGV